MAITILLVILILTLTIVGLAIYFFWKKIGKPLFNMMDNLNKMSQTMTKGNRLPDFTLYQKEMMKIQDMLNKHNKTKKK
jgi:phosphoglycerate-specific signal transduction histidine kinase